MNYDSFMIALCIWREARGSSLAAMTAVYHVILNRVADPRGRWPKTIVQVILQHEQFSSFNANDPNAMKFPIQPVTGSSLDWDAWMNCCTVVANTSLTADPTQGATNYVSVDSMGKVPSAANSWAKAENLTYQVGAFRFFKV